MFLIKSCEFKNIKMCIILWIAIFNNLEIKRLIFYVYNVKSE